MLRRHHGFTLIELLVVISIIALLISLLLPALAQTRKEGRAIVCAANLGQLSLAVATYGVDSGYFPIGITRSGGIWIWPSILRQHMGGGMEAFYCPQADDYTRWVRKYGSGLPASEGYDDDEVRLRAGGQSFLGYGYNVWGSHIARQPNTGLGVYRGHPNYGEQKIRIVRQPSDMVAFADSNYTVESNWSAFVGLEAPRQYPSEIHSGTANVAFVDTHVERLGPQEIADHWNPQVNQRWNVHNKPMFGLGGTW